MIKKKRLTKVEQTVNLLMKYYSSKDISSINKLIKRSKIDLINESFINIDNSQVILFFLMAVPKKKTSEIYRYLPNELQDEIVGCATNNQVKILFNELHPDEILDIANRNQSNFKKILLNLSSKQRELIKRINKFENDEAGSIMNPEFFVFQDTWTIKTCLNEYKKAFNDIEQNNVFYVANKKKHIVGWVRINDLIFNSNYNKKIRSIIDESFLTVNQKDDIENVIDIFQDYHLDNIPVVNTNNEIVGIINNNDILPAIEEEITEDIYNMYGIQKTDESYLKSGIWKIVKSRLLWVILLMIGATLTSVAISLFENLGIALTSGLSSILLVPILPVITGTAGNTGSQSFATTVRSISVGEITPKEYKIVVWKEFQIGTLLGLLLAIANVIRLCIYFIIPQFRLNENGDVLPYIYTLAISIGSSLALWISVIIAKLLGALLPIIAMKLKLDPTIMCGPMISTFLDLSSTSLLFGIGIVVLHYVIMPLIQIV